MKKRVVCLAILILIVILIGSANAEKTIGVVRHGCAYCDKSIYSLADELTMNYGLVQIHFIDVSLCEHLLVTDVECTLNDEDGILMSWSGIENDIDRMNIPDLLNKYERVYLVSVMSDCYGRYGWETKGELVNDDRYFREMQYSACFTEKQKVNSTRYIRYYPVIRLYTTDGCQTKSYRIDLYSENIDFDQPDLFMYQDHAKNGHGGICEIVPVISNED